jgi:hypothetical protein
LACYKAAAHILKHKCEELKHILIPKTGFEHVITLFAGRNTAALDCLTSVFGTEIPNFLSIVE